MMLVSLEDEKQGFTLYSYILLKFQQERKRSASAQINYKIKKNQI